MGLLVDNLMAGPCTACKTAQSMCFLLKSSFRSLKQNGSKIEVLVNSSRSRMFEDGKAAQDSYIYIDFDDNSNSAKAGLNTSM